MKILSKAVLTALTITTAALSQSANAALITFTDDGTNTTIAWTGAFDSSGLIIASTVDPTGLSTNPNFWTNGLFVDSGDLVLLSGSGAMIDQFALVGVASGGWTDPSGDSGTMLSAVTADVEFALNAVNARASFTSSGDGSAVLPGSLDDNGFTAGGSLTFNNPNVTGESGQIVLQAIAVPEPSTALMAFVGAAGLLMRRRRV